MTRILGIDPGATTGWCIYDSELRRAVAAGEFKGHAAGYKPEFREAWDSVGGVVIEKPVAYGPTRPEVVEAAYVTGRLVEIMERIFGPEIVTELTRLEVKRILTIATNGEITVKNDATAWAALCLLHGDGAATKARRKSGQVVAEAGPLGIATGHARAAVAVAVAYHLFLTVPTALTIPTKTQP